LRSTNTGITAVVDHQGNVIKVAPQFEEDMLKANVDLVEGKTPYSRWGIVSQWVIASCILLVYLLNRIFIRYKPQFRRKV
jgi:apolipoprotein N-acyltransferase